MDRITLLKKINMLFTHHRTALYRRQDSVSTAVLGSGSASKVQIHNAIVEWDGEGDLKSITISLDELSITIDAKEVRSRNIPVMSLSKNARLYREVNQTVKYIKKNLSFIKEMDDEAFQAQADLEKRLTPKSTKPKPKKGFFAWLKGLFAAKK